MAEETATSTRQSLYDEYATPDTPLTHRLLLLIVIVFLFEIVGVLIFSLSTIRVFATGIFQIWPWVAWPLSPLLHKGMNHIALNFLLLLLVGVPVERYWDDTQYAVFLLVVGYVTVLCGAGIMAVFLISNQDLTNDSFDEDEGEDVSVDDAIAVRRDVDKERDMREGMVDEFADVIDEDTDEVERLFSEFLEELYEQEEEWESRGGEADKRLYALFKTNHPDLDLVDEDMDEVEKAHIVSRIIRWYRFRWGIENGFKQIKQFRVRTMSMKYHYRFFNFIFACTLYNVWRLVDLLVKLELMAESEFAYKPLVTADLFLTIASDYFGLDPLD